MKKKIKIGYEDIVINIINFETEDKKDDNVLGEYDSSNAKIDIQKEQNARSEANTLLHEVIHACVYQTGLNSQGNLLSKEENEELIVNAISNSLSAQRSSAVSSFRNFQNILNLSFNGG